MLSAVDICNNALQELGAEPIIGFDQGTKEARLCRQFYETERDLLLRGYPWNFAARRKTLAREAQDPDFGYSSAFTLPEDFIQVRAVYGYDGDWVVEGGTILTNSDTCRLQYTARITDPNRFGAGFVAALRSALTARLAYPITMSATRTEQAGRRFQQMLEETTFADSREGGDASAAFDDEILKIFQ